MKNIRNFCIIAHIDHGKTSLADCLLKYTKTINNINYKKLLLDDMDIEKERGITIKSHPINMEFIYKNQKYILNLIDTPGHVDFSYEVSRSIGACEGAILLIDASKGIQAQTISNFFLAYENNLQIIPVINKIDIKNYNFNQIIDEIIDLTGCQINDIIHISAKYEIGINQLLEQIILKIPYPKGNKNLPLQALIFDSKYDNYRGIQIYFKIENGTIHTGDKLKFLSNGKICKAEEIGILKIKKYIKTYLSAGHVGYLIIGIRDFFSIQIGDTITSVINPCKLPIKGFKKIKPVVFSGIYPIETDKYEDLKISLNKLKLNDSSLIIVPESSNALGFGFRCGFLGILHMEIIKERLEREYNIYIITTIPNVSYHIFLKTQKNIPYIINNPSDYSFNLSSIDRIEEPYILANIITNQNFIGSIISLCIKKRGIIKNQLFLNQKKIKLIFELPLSEIIFDFYDNLKTISRGYSTFDYYEIGYRKSNLIKINILINYKNVDALSILVNKNNAFYIAKKICIKLKELIPKQQFDIPIQASINNKIITRETIKALRKDVTAKCYGGDISRKRKLIEKQKKGKKKMRQIGNVKIPQAAFIAIMKIKN